MPIPRPEREFVPCLIRLPDGRYFKAMCRKSEVIDGLYEAHAYRSDIPAKYLPEWIAPPYFDVCNMLALEETVVIVTAEGYI